MTSDKQKQFESHLAAVNAVLRSMELARTTNPEDAWRYSSFAIYMRKYNQLLKAVAAIEPPDVPLDLYDEKQIPSPYDTVSVQQNVYFQSAHANLSILKSWLEQKVGKVAQEASSLGTFLQAKLRSAMFDAPANEIEVQDCIEQLFIGRGFQKGIDYDRETGRVRFSSKECVPDFICKPLSLALEVKLLKDASRQSKLIDEINADIVAYSKGYESLIFLIYDMGIIRDEVEFRRDLEAAGNVSILIVKH